MYAYRVFEGALAEAFGIKEPALPTFRARLKYLRRLGLTGQSSVEGKNIRYSLNDVYRFGFMIELSQFGVDPQRMRQILFGPWKSVMRELPDTEDIPGNDVYFAAYPEMLSAFIVESMHDAPHEAAGLTTIDPRDLRYVFYASELPDLMSRRMLLINLTFLRSRIRKAVDILEHKTQPPQPKSRPQES